MLLDRISKHYIMIVDYGKCIVDSTMHIVEMSAFRLPIVELRFLELRIIFVDSKVQYLAILWTFLQSQTVDADTNQTFHVCEQV